MIINHNIAALNTHRQLTSASNAQAKSMEKLSSGLRINRAGDDAAGLAISEKMRGQIRGLDQATRNSQDAISLIQTGEGALNETHSILQRMRELAVQSSNDTNTDTDRKEIQKEVTQLKSEIDRISNTTEFNTKKLLDGSVGNNAAFNGANDVALKSVSVTDSSLKSDTYTITQGNPATLAATVSSNNTGIATADIDLTAGVTNTSGVTALELGDYTLETTATATAGKFDYSLKNKDGIVVASAAAADITAGAVVMKGNNPDGTAVQFSLKQDATATVQAGKMSFNVNATYAAGDFSIADSASNTTYTSATNTKISTSDFEAGGFSFKMTTDTALAAAAKTTKVDTHNNSLTMQIGANQGQTMNVDINKMDTKSLNISSVDVSTAAGAQSAISSINKAIEQVSSERSKLGAVQNRLEHTINNLGTSSENLTAAESRIRDVDMAKEMMNQTKNSILSQAAQAMLAQSNQMPQGVLQLLR